MYTTGPRLTFAGKYLYRCSGRFDRALKSNANSQLHTQSQGSRGSWSNDFRRVVFMEFWARERSGKGNPVQFATGSSYKIAQSENCIAPEGCIVKQIWQQIDYLSHSVQGLVITLVFALLIILANLTVQIKSAIPMPSANTNEYRSFQRLACEHNDVSQDVKGVIPIHTRRRANVVDRMGKDQRQSIFRPQSDVQCWAVPLQIQMRRRRERRMEVMVSTRTICVPLVGHGPVGQGCSTVVRPVLTSTNSML